MGLIRAKILSKHISCYLCPLWQITIEDIKVYHGQLLFLAKNERFCKKMMNYD